MLRHLRPVFLGLLATLSLLGALLLAGFLLPAELHTSTSRVLSTTPEAIRPHLRTPAGWVRWWSEVSRSSSDAAPWVLITRPARDRAAPRFQIEREGHPFEIWSPQPSDGEHTTRYRVDAGWLVTTREFTLNPLDSSHTEITWVDRGPLPTPWVRWVAFLEGDAARRFADEGLRALGTLLDEHPTPPSTNDTGLDDTASPDPGP